jgi:spore coat polysaccharide biosynthesis predicted glycosyltransferase SpsG
MGGVDKRNRTPTIVRAFSNLNLSVTAVCGPGYKNESEIRSAAAEVDATVVINPDDLPELMFEADFAVATLGTTTYELMATKTPIIGIPDNETPMAEALRKRDAAIVLDREPGCSEIESAIGQMIHQEGFRRRLCEQYQTLVTGEGAENIAKELESLID